MILDKTKILKVTKNADTEEDIQNLLFAADIIKKGGLVVFPTETVYGLGANALDENAAKKIYEAKGRPQNNPLIIHIDNKEDIGKYCESDGVYGLEQLKALMPAPLTVILPAKDIVPRTVTGGLDTVAVRVPTSKIARKIIELSGCPIAAPSANLSGKPSPTTASHVLEDMNGRVDVIIDGGNCEVGLESTIVTLCEEVPTLLRPGGITYEMLCDLLGEVHMSRAVLDSLKPGDKVLSPGMMYKHYAPDKPVVLLKGDRLKAISYINENNNGKCVVICYDEDQRLIENARVLCAGSRSDNSEYAKKLFALLRDTNSIDADTVFAFLPEDTSGISLAIYNRLLRAAGFNVMSFEGTKIIGLTGATGAGKGSFGKVAREKYGLIHIDTDKTARSVVEPGKPCLEEIREYFGSSVINADGTLNRKALGSIVFTDGEKLKKLNELTHHYITDEVNAVIAAAKEAGERAVIIDAPLLFESGEDKLCHVTVGVVADKDVRKCRIMSRDGISEEMAENRIASGKDTAFFTERCDYIIENNSCESDFEEKICRLLDKILGE